jgi:16S rRNA processing protein RimM
VEPDIQPSFIAIARIARTRGNRGEVLADLYTDFPDRFDDLEEVWLESGKSPRRRMALEESWEHKGRRVLKFSGVDSISSAEDYVGNWVVIPADQAVVLPEGTYFDHDLVGCIVQDVQGNRLGVVQEVLHIAGNNLFAVSNGNREYLIPVVANFCKQISIREKQILVDLPEGLMDLGK